MSQIILKKDAGEKEEIVKKSVERNNRRHAIAKHTALLKSKAANSAGFIGCSTCFNFLKIPATATRIESTKQAEIAEKPNC